MQGRAQLAGVGTGITVFVLVAVVVIERLDFEFSAIVGLPVGVVTGVGAAVLVAARYDDAGRGPRALADAAAGFGYAAVVLLAVRYVDLAGLRAAVTVQRLAAVAAVTALVAFAVSLLAGSRAGRE